MAKAPAQQQVQCQTCRSVPYTESSSEEGSHQIQIRQKLRSGSGVLTTRRMLDPAAKSCLTKVLPLSSVR